MLNISYQFVTLHWRIVLQTYAKWVGRWNPVRERCGLLRSKIIFFLDLKYNLGEQTGKKSSGEDVASQMRRARGQDGKRLFAVNDSLTTQQISSYFSRMAAKRKNVTEAEVDTEERENLIRDVTAEITEKLVAEEQQQPVSEDESRGCCYSYRRVNLCRMSRDELRAKLTLPNLKSICLKYGIQGVSRNRKKEPYVDALFSFIEARPCSLHKSLP